MSNQPNLLKDIAVNVQIKLLADTSGLLQPLMRRISDDRFV